MSATESPNRSKSMLRTGIAGEEAPQREWPAPTCGCCQYEHPYNRRHSRWAAFLYVFLCPALALGDNEAMLQELSSERDGLLGPRCCTGRCPQGQSPEAACASMSLCACCSMMACAWPLLCALTQTQRSHVTKEFRINEESQSTMQRLCRAAFCMPCSLLQVHMLLDECKHELLFSRSWAANSSPFTSRHIYTPPGEESSRIASGVVAQAAADAAAAERASAEGSPGSPYSASPCSSSGRTPPDRHTSRSSAGSNGEMYLTAPSVQSMTQSPSAEAAPASPLAARAATGLAAAGLKPNPPQLPLSTAAANGAAAAAAPVRAAGGSPAGGEQQRMNDAAEARAAASSYASSLRNGVNGDAQRSLVDQIRSRAGAGAAPAMSPGRTLRRKPAADLSCAGESFTVPARQPRQPHVYVPQPAQLRSAAAPGMTMASLDADTAMEAEVPHTVWAAAVDGSPSSAAEGLARHGAATHAHASLSPQRSGDAGDGEPQLARFHSHGSTQSSGSRRPPPSPRSSLQPSAAYDRATAPAACRSPPQAGSAPLGLGNAVLAPPPSCNIVPMSPSPGPYATIARCQSQPMRTMSDRERVEASRDGCRASEGTWHGSAPTAAAVPSPTAAEYYRKSSGLHSAASSDSGAPVSPPAIPLPMDSAAAALLASEAMAAAAALGQGRVPPETQQRLLDRVESMQGPLSSPAYGALATTSNNEFITVTETHDEGGDGSSTQHTVTSSLSSISSTCSNHSRSSTVQGGGALSSLLSRPGVDQFSSFGNPLAEAAAAEAAAARHAPGGALPMSTGSSWPGGAASGGSSGLAASAAPAVSSARSPLGAGVLPGLAFEQHGAVEDSGIVHQESDGAWRVQWRPLAPVAPPRHVPRPAVPPPPSAVPDAQRSSARARGGRSVQPIRKWEDALRENGVTPPPAAAAQLSVAQLIELQNTTATTGDSRDTPAEAAHDSFLSDLSF
eukprot:jgi/Ulvmu1/10981/UM007_0160.1